MQWLSRLTWLWILTGASIALSLWIFGENSFADGGVLDYWRAPIGFLALFGAPLSFGWMCVLATHGKLSYLVTGAVGFLVSLCLGMAYANAIGGFMPERG